ncbi:hypothetical protein SAMN05421736_105214 [Evansella caseinilytica]|uniref:Uncharacterized protein n=1 Tax=Evansella caseinilytica TaxID=1503961 RepID=A0A1H3PUT4_9BACI|nr:hypothetical protein SAMN05421736_105214 [Evansella caseinilytica]
MCFLFADSIVKISFFAIDTIDEKIVDIDFKTKKVIQSYEDFKTFLFEMLLEGKENLTDGIFFEFEV